MADRCSRSDLRPVHGHVMVCERVGSNGGLARYHLTIEPWLAFLGYRKDSYALHDAAVLLQRELKLPEVAEDD